MTVEQFVSTIATLAGLTFVVGSMFATGLSLTVGQIVQPLKNARLVILALVANFALVPLLGYVITLVIPLDEPLKVGLIVLSTVAGAPFLIKEVQASKGKLSLGVGLMFLLMIVTIFYVPLVLPLLLPGVDVNAGEIAKSLIVTMLIPIVIGLLVRSHSAEGAKHWAPVMNRVSGIALLLMLVAGLGLNISNIIDLVGSYGFLALVVFVVGSLAIGFVCGGRDADVRSTLGLGTAQRNVAAAILVASLNFAGTDTLTYVLVASIVLPLILLPAARLIGKRRRGRETGPPRRTNRRPRDASASTSHTKGQTWLRQNESPPRCRWTGTKSGSPTAPWCPPTTWTRSWAGAARSSRRSAWSTPTSATRPRTTGTRTTSTTSTTSIRMGGLYPPIHVNADLRRTVLLGATWVYEGGCMAVRARDDIFKMSRPQGQEDRHLEEPQHHQERLVAHPGAHGHPEHAQAQRHDHGRHRARRVPVSGRLVRQARDAPGAHEQPVGAVDAPRPQARPRLPPARDRAARAARSTPSTRRARSSSTCRRPRARSR